MTPDVKPLGTDVPQSSEQCGFRMATGASPPHPQIPQTADTPTARRGEAGTALGAGQSAACRALVWPHLATQSNTELLGFYNFLKGLGTIKCSETKVSWLFYFSAGAFPPPGSG